MANEKLMGGARSAAEPANDQDVTSATDAVAGKSSLAETDLATLVFGAPATSRSAPPPALTSFPVAATGDMIEVDWHDLAAIPVVGTAAWSPAIESKAPAPPTPVRPPTVDCGPVHHANPIRPLDQSPYIELGRAEAWAEYTATAGDLASTWNTAAALHDQYELTTDAHKQELRDVHNFQLASGAGNLHSVANHQAAGRNGTANPVQVGDLFHTETVANHRISTGTELEISKRAEQGIDDAGGKVNAELEGVRVADAALGEGVGKVQTAVVGVRAGQLSVQGALGRISTTRAKRELAGAEDAQAGIENQVADMLRVVRDLTQVVDGISGGLAAGSVLGGISAVANSAAVESIASRMIDAAYAKRLNSAKAAVARASGRLEGAIDSEERTNLHAATAGLDKELQNLLAMRANVPGLLAARRSAYETLASAAAKRSGTTAGSQANNEIRGAIAAIPIVDVVVSRAEAARDAASLPGYRSRAGQGLGVATYHKLDHAVAFVQHAGKLMYLREHYQDHAEHWAARRDSLHTVVARLANNEVNP